MPSDDKSSKDGEKQFSIQPVPGAEQNQGKAGFDPKFAAHHAAPGPAINNLGGVPLEGTKEERMARAAELNK
ncbi:hypothetical protein TD95_000816 [Thielaviopsis punctulata]|uniref:Uncharacterized protein n=1 Tax=Thielaviopsis punctulata TaxID=72032 RepID=A0A0F4ZLY1_9PEZI|nr:hypothetical protein TD95_000816 [Thielaviopsis punctulata]